MIQPFKNYTSHKEWLESDEFKVIHKAFLESLLDSDDDRMNDQDRREEAWHWFLRGYRASASMRD